MKNKLLVAIIVLAGALSLRAGPAAAATLIVDDDRSQCPRAQHTSIAAAIADHRAAPGATVVVCPGRYAEAVTVTAPGLTLKAHGGGNAAPVRCFDESPQPIDPTRAAVVAGAPYSFNLAADGVQLRGFVIEGADYGIVTAPEFSGYVIHRNLVENSTRAGINLRASGAMATVVSHNCLRGNERGIESENPGTLHRGRVATTRPSGTGGWASARPACPVSART